SKASTTKRESVASSPEAPVAGSPSPELHSLEFERESSTDEVINSVRCLYFGRSFIINNIVTTPTLWVGTSNGSIYIYTITLPATGCRTSDAVTCQLGKEIQLKHQAPILGIQIVDHSGYPLPDPLDVQYQRSKPADLTGSHRVLVCTEEQIKVFTLPSMKPFCKNKITLTEGYHISKVGFSTFPKRSDPKVCEYCAICLSDSNGITLYSIPELRRFISYNYCCLESLDIFSKTVFAQNGLMVCLIFPSEFEIISLSTSTTGKPVCQIEIPVNAMDAISSLDKIVLMPNICLKNSKLDLVDDSSLAESIDPQMQNELNDIEDLTEQARFSPMVSRDRASFQLVEIEAEVHENIAAEVQDNAVSLNGDVQQQQVRKAPLAVIEELNSSEESHLNLINNVSRRNDHVS
ncbi:lethal(2) giant larvae protein homolog 1-like, partial [Stegodyphus dumicola]|uniref:lethal(2) giant larvae protein homolog 1-like n=1 Tax=Stegodyphus dumicola TaxID=202533 RepID=UPI0015B264CF